MFKIYEKHEEPASQVIFADRVCKFFCQKSHKAEKSQAIQKARFKPSFATLGIFVTDGRLPTTDTSTGAAGNSPLKKGSLMSVEVASRGT